MKKRRQQIFLGLLVSAVAFIHPAPGDLVDAQNQRTDKFGSSLKRLKWDAAKGAAVEVRKRKTKKNERPQDLIRLQTLLVVFDVLVTDKTASRFKTGLGKEDFTVSEDDHPEQIATFAQGDDQVLPRSIVLLIDYSGSQAAYLEASIEAAKRLVTRLASADEMAIVTDDVELLIGFTGDKAKLAAALDSMKRRAAAKRREKVFGLPVTGRRGRDLQFTALFATLRELVKNRSTRPIIIFQTDGTEAPTLRDQPEASDYVWNMPERPFGLADIYAAAERSRATIYTVIPNVRLIRVPRSELYERGRQMLNGIVRARFESDEDYRAYSQAHPIPDAQVRLLTDRFAESQTAAARAAELTGGWTAFLERPEQASDIYGRILSDIDRRYIIGYYPTNTKQDGRLRKVRIEVRGHPEYIVHGRTSYYAPDDHD